MAKFNRYETTQLSLITGETIATFRFGTWKVAERHSKKFDNCLESSILVTHCTANGVVMRYSGGNRLEFMRLMNTIQRIAQVLVTPVGWTHADA